MFITWSVPIIYDDAHLHMIFIKESVANLSGSLEYQQQEWY